MHFFASKTGRLSRQVPVLFCSAEPGVRSTAPIGSEVHPGLLSSALMSYFTMSYTRRTSSMFFSPRLPGKRSLIEASIERREASGATLVRAPSIAVLTIGRPVISIARWVASMVRTWSSSKESFVAISAERFGEFKTTFPFSKSPLVTLTMLRSDESSTATNPGL